jgi:hypothetical protein
MRYALIRPKLRQSKQRESPNMAHSSGNWKPQMGQERGRRFVGAEVGIKGLLL